MSDTEALVASLLVAVAAAPHDVPLRLHLARLYAERGQGEEAVRHAAAALVDEPGHPDARALMTRLLGVSVSHLPTGRPVGLSEVRPPGRLPRRAAPRDPHPASPQDGAGHRPPLQPTASPGAPGPPPVPSSAVPPSPPVAPPGEPGGAAPAVPLVASAPGDSPFPPAPMPVATDHASRSVDAPRRPRPAPAAPVLDVPRTWAVERSTVTLAEVGGRDTAKESLESVLAPMRNPELRRLSRTSRAGGVLLYGPPGCGRTFLARAVAGELGARFVSIDLPRVVTAEARSGGGLLTAAFHAARQTPPVVVYLDGLECLTAGADSGQVARVRAELEDEFDRHGVGAAQSVYVLGASGAPWDVDPRLRRPGRFARTLLVLPPDQEAREVILAELAGSPQAHRVDLAELALRTEGFSGTDLRQLWEVATRTAAATSRRTGRPRPVDDEDVRVALASVTASTPAWLENAHANPAVTADATSFAGLLEYLRARRS